MWPIVIVIIAILLAIFFFRHKRVVCTEFIGSLNLSDVDADILADRAPLMFKERLDTIREFKSLCKELVLLTELGYDTKFNTYIDVGTYETTTIHSLWYNTESSPHDVVISCGDQFIPVSVEPSHVLLLSYGWSIDILDKGVFVNGNISSFII